MLHSKRLSIRSRFGPGAATRSDPPPSLRAANHPVFPFISLSLPSIYSLMIDLMRWGQKEFWSPPSCQLKGILYYHLLIRFVTAFHNACTPPPARSLMTRARYISLGGRPKKESRRFNFRFFPAWLPGNLSGVVSRATSPDSRGGPEDHTRRDRGEIFQDDGGGSSRPGASQATFFRIRRLVVGTVLLHCTTGWWGFETLMSPITFDRKTMQKGGPCRGPSPGTVPTQRNITRV